MNKLHYRGYRSCGLLLALLWMPGAVASEFVLEEIVVTAQKREQSITDAPLTVNLLSAEALESVNAFDFEEVAKLAPGLELSPNDSQGAKVTLRGNGFQSNTLLQPAVTVLYDDIVQNRVGSVFNSLLDVASIEVLRGPQGTLYGKNSPAGAIKIVTNEPHFEGFEFNLTGSVESIQSNNSGAADGVTGTRIQGALNIPLIDDVLALRVAGLINDDNGFWHNAWLDDEVGGRERDALQAKLLWQPSDSLDLTLLYKRTTSDTEFADGLYNDDLLDEDPLSPLMGGSVTPFDHEVYLRRQTFAEDEDELWGLTINWDLDAHTLTLVNGMETFSEYINEPAGPGPSAASILVNQFEREVLSHEFRIVSDRGGVWEYVAGIFYSDERLISSSPSTRETGTLAVDSGNFAGPDSRIFNSDITSLFSFDENNNAFALLTNGYSGTGSISLGTFWNNTFQLTDEFSVVAGLRYSRDQVSVDQVSTVLQGQAISATVDGALEDQATTLGLPDGTSAADIRAAAMASPALAGTVDQIEANTLAAIAARQIPGIDLILPQYVTDDEVADTDVSATLKLVYQPTDELTTYVSYDRTTKPGGLSAGTSDTLAALGLGEYEEETSDAFEIGVKGTGLDGRLRYSLAAYHQTYDEFQFYAFGARQGQIVNPGLGGLVIESLAGSGLVQLNAEEATSRGLEGEFTFLVTERFLVNGAFAWNKTELENAVRPISYTDVSHPTFVYNGTRFLCHASISPSIPSIGFDSSTCPASVSDYASLAALGGVIPDSAAALSGVIPIETITKDDLGLAAEFSATLMGEYRAPLNWGGDKEWFGRLFWRHNSGREDGVQGDQILDSYQTLDATIGFLSDEKGWQISFWGKNILDEEYLVNANSDDATEGGPGAPASFGITVSISTRAL